MNNIRVDLNRTHGPINRNIFGGFAEHLGRCIYGGIYDPESPHADDNGLRKDVLDALQRLGMPLMRYPGGNFVSGYRWRDGVGPKDQRPHRAELAWATVEPNAFGTDEFVDFCRKLGTEPYLAVNAGDGDLREARDWVEYCNGQQPTSLVKMRHANGYEQPHNVRYWGIGNEVDGPWQIGYKTAYEYARAYTEFAKVMRLVDPTIELIASGVSAWNSDWVERTQQLIEHAGPAIDYIGIHWYMGNINQDFAEYMTLSEVIEGRLSAYEGLIHALRLEHNIRQPIHIAVDEWNVWYRTHPHVTGTPATTFEYFQMQAEDGPAEPATLEEIYNLEDALVTAMHFNAFIRHAQTVQMANIAQVVNVIAPIFTRPDGLFLQTIFYPFELYRQTCGTTALDVGWDGETFSGGEHTGVRVLDVSATLDDASNQLTVYAINRHPSDAMPVEIKLAEGSFDGTAQIHIVNGPDIDASNSFDHPDNVTTRQTTMDVSGSRATLELEPHAVTAFVCRVK